MPTIDTLKRVFHCPFSSIVFSLNDTVTSKAYLYLAPLYSLARLSIPIGTSSLALSFNNLLKIFPLALFGTSATNTIPPLNCL